ncbi:MAG: hypothetical protein J2P31_06960 [Blastocatellia bacterium]|nr:hypothetical protein [Blastocatellia bacterium]
MADKQNEDNPFYYLIDSFWASLPEKTADQLATFKKDVLRAIKDSVDTCIERDIKATDEHLENARRMREQYRQKRAEGPSPA